MKKTSRIIITVIACIGLFLIVSFLMLELLGFRFRAESLILADSKSDSGSTIETDGYIFNFYSVDVIDDNNTKIGEFIDGMQVIEKHGFLYKLNSDSLNKPAFSLCTSEGEYAGTLFVFDDAKTKHCFYHIPRLAFPKTFPKNWFELSSVSVNGSDRELIKGSYFTTKEDFDSVIFGECELFLSEWAGPVETIPENYFDN